MGVEFVIPIVLFLSIAGVAIVYRKYANDERMALIEKGADASLFKHESSSQPVLRISLLFVGAGLGLLVASMIEWAFPEPETAYFSMIFLCGGLGLLAAYFIESRAKARKKE